MKPGGQPTFMFIAGESSGDMLAAELVTALKKELTPRHESRLTNHSPQFFGAGGAKMAASGVELAFDLTQHSVIGPWDALKSYDRFKRLFERLVALAFDRRPDVIVCVDFSVFNHRFAERIRWELEVRRTTHGNWKPKIVKYVSPQVWASRPGRAKSMPRLFDLLLTIFPFEKAWYAARVPELKVEFVGHPAVDRFNVERSNSNVERSQNSVLLLPGSRVGELKRHLPVMLAAFDKIRAANPNAEARMVLPNDSLLQLAQELGAPANLKIQVGDLPSALASSTVAIASTGTVTMECAWFGLPTIAIYKTSWATFQIGKRIIQVKFLAMPNILADEAIYPEFIQDDATSENLCRTALELLGDPAKREAIRRKLAAVTASLGEPGASHRAARAVVKLADSSP
ncbi:MAG: lipid-A-disaccharide synthase [Verrucomicrobia bacterium]|nr:lipid-A-disaccharide synthase [Verrucomicrobiota bacterium]